VLLAGGKSINMACDRHVTRIDRTVTN